MIHVMRGYYKKYDVKRTDGLKTYAQNTPDVLLAEDLLNILAEFEE